MSLRDRGYIEEVKANKPKKSATMNYPKEVAPAPENKNTLNYLFKRFMKGLMTQVADKLPDKTFDDGVSGVQIHTYSHSANAYGKGKDSKGKPFNWEVSIGRGNESYRAGIRLRGYISKGPDERYKINILMDSNDDPAEACQELVDWMKGKVGAK